MLSNFARVSSLSPHIGAPFTAIGLRHARVAWLNERHFWQVGVNVLDATQRNELVKWLLDNFAFAVPRIDYLLPGDAEPDNLYNDKSRVFHADRYGAPGGTAGHGGSGRCGIAADYNVKGIGRTPLISASADWYHAHGCVWLEEAIREAVYAEVAFREFPHAAVPIIAVIDVGEPLRRCDGNEEPRRGLIVRPNFIRPAHFERSILFGCGGSPKSPQYIDALRTQDAVEAFCAHCAGKLDLNVKARNIHETLANTAEQIGFGRAHRLFHGPYYSSNLTVDGELVDFGNFRSVGCWRRIHGFGLEDNTLSQMISSLEIYFAKYGDSANRIESKKAIEAVRNSVQKSFRHACLAAITFNPELDSEADPIADILCEYFYRQQRELCAHQSSLPWLYDAITSREKGGANEQWALHELKSAFKSERFLDRREALRQRTACWLKPRRLGYRENLIRISKLLLQRSTEQVTQRPLQCIVDDIIGRLRRNWPLAPNFIVLSQYSTPLGTVLYCYDIEKSLHWAWIEAIVHEENAALFSHSVAIRDVPAGWRLPSPPGLLHLLVPSVHADSYSTIRFGQIDVTLPPPNTVFPMSG